MEKKIKWVIECFIILLAIIYYVLKVMIPEYRNTIGSSDRYIKSSSVKNIIEIQIDNSTNFAILLDHEGNIYHLFFFDNNSVSLYNKNIESQSLEDGLEKIFQILIENNILNSGSDILIIRTNDNHYTKFKKLWGTLSQKYTVILQINEEKKSIEQKARELGLNTDSYSSMLFEMDFYSKKIVKNSDNNQIKLNNKNSFEYAKELYNKIEEYEKISTEPVEISLIPADKNHHYYPTRNSWYKKKDNKIYAYIEFQEDNNVYSYCFKGSINEWMKGECKE